MQVSWRGCGCIRRIRTVSGPSEEGTVASELRLKFPENYEAVRWAFDLSRNPSFRMLETTARSIASAGDTTSDFFKTILSTVTSPLPLNLLINYDIYEDHCRMRFYAGRISQATGPPKPSFTWGYSKCSARYMWYGSFDWCSVRMFRIVLPRMPDERWSASSRTKG